MSTSITNFFKSTNRISESQKQIQEDEVDEGKKKNSSPTKGLVRVGTQYYDQKTHKNIQPFYPGFKNIVPLTASNSPEWFDFSPYKMKTRDGALLENAYQSSKAYARVPESRQFYPRGKLAWDWPSEVHISIDPKSGEAANLFINAAKLDLSDQKVKELLGIAPIDKIIEVCRKWLNEIKDTKEKFANIDTFTEKLKVEISFVESTKSEIEIKEEDKETLICFLQKQWYLNEKWEKWNHALRYNTQPIRYPVTADIEERGKCIGVYDPQHCKSKNVRHLIKIPKESRRKVYFRDYFDALNREKDNPKLKLLQQWHDNGQNLNFVDVDGIKSRSMQHYKDTYGVEDDFCDRDTVLINEKNLRILLDDPKESCGHTFALAAHLMGLRHVFDFN